VPRAHAIDVGGGEGDVVEAAGVLELLLVPRTNALAPRLRLPKCTVGTPPE
jgi:hypothetical protein